MSLIDQVNELSAKRGGLQIVSTALNVLKVKIGNQYGQRVIHPACEKSNLFCDLLQCKTFTQRQIDKLKALGYTLKVVQDLPKEL